MSKNYYAEINLHLIWHTKLSMPVLTGRVETLTHQFIRQKLINTPGAFIHEMAAPTIVGREFRGSRKSHVR